MKDELIEYIIHNTIYLWSSDSGNSIEDIIRKIKRKVKKYEYTNDCTKKDTN